MLGKCLAAILADTGFNVALNFKEFEVPKELSGCLVVEHQQEAADFISERIAPRYKMCQDVAFVKADGVWNLSPKSVTRELRNIVGHDFDLFYEAANGLKPANKCATHINQIVELLQPDQEAHSRCSQS